MISVFFNEAGYHIKGDGIEVARSCPPAFTESGSSILPPLHHLYAVLYYVLKEVQTSGGQEDIFIYNDSRIIEEINGVADTMDDVSKRWLRHIRRTLIPAIGSCVVFRKKAPELINQKVQDGLGSMIHNVDTNARDAAMKQHVNQIKERRTSDRASRIRKFKENWDGNRQEQ